MLADVGMIRRALKGDVERDFEAEPARLANEVIEVVECAEARVDRLVPAGLGSNRPRTAGIAGAQR